MTATLITAVIIALLLALAVGVATTDRRWKPFSWPLFFIFLFSIFLVGALLQPIGVNYRYPWLPLVVFGFFLFLFVLALTPAENIRWRRRTSPAVPPDTQALSVLSMGFFTWILLLFLLSLLFSSFWFWWPWT